MSRTERYMASKTVCRKNGVSVEKDDEIFSFMFRRWNVSKAVRLLRERNRRPVVLDMSSGWGWLGSEPGQGEWVEQPDGSKKFTGSMGIIRINWGYVSKITPERLKEPLILGTIKLEGRKTGNMLLDGWHRLARARQLGIKKLPVYLLTLKETDKITL